MEESGQSEFVKSEILGLLSRSEYETVFVREKLNKEEELLKYIYSHAVYGDIESVLKSIDTFGWKHWMMNMGDGTKMKLMVNYLLQIQPKVMLELGTYCGYSSLKFASILPSSSRIYSVETHPECIAVASAIHNYAKVEPLGKIQILCGNLNDNLDTLKQRISMDLKCDITSDDVKIDLVLLDHEKNYYLNDLKLLEASGLLKKGTVVIADNVIFPGAPEYLKYVRSHSEFKSEFFEGMLEYVEESNSKLIDGIEVSTRL
mmetsp:Transcript_11396/g.20609  ORF Transcript_11396/g.20609 Transcript_11396/m.20609 type:complete len:260 (-) Transcript_11396:2128-2907(-)